MNENFAGITWVIIGSCTGTQAGMIELVQRYPELTLMPYGKKWTAQPKIEWIQEIVEAADKAGIPVFLKDNLFPLLRPEIGKNSILQRPLVEKDLRQEFPKGV